MLYYLADALTPRFGVFNLFNYHTIRAMIQCSNRLNKLLQSAN